MANWKRVLTKTLFITIYFILFYSYLLSIIACGKSPDQRHTHKGLGGGNSKEMPVASIKHVISFTSETKVKGIATTFPIVSSQLCSFQLQCTRVFVFLFSTAALYEKICLFFSCFLSSKWLLAQNHCYFRFTKEHLVF